MLRWLAIARLALQHSPETEQRLLSYAKKDEKLYHSEFQNDPETPEKSTPDRASAEGVIERLTAETADRMQETAPEQFLVELCKREDLVELLSTTSILREKMKQIASTLSIQDLDALTLTERQTFLEKLLPSMGDEELLSAIQIIRDKIEYNDQLLAIAEKQMRNILKNSDDPAAVQQALHQVVTSESQQAVHELPSQLASGSITEENVAEKLKLRGQYSSIERRRVYEGLLDIVRSKKLRNLPGQKRDAREFEEPVDQVRQKFLASLYRSSDLLARYADARINARAARLMPKIDELSEKFQGTTASQYNISAEGIEDALCSAIITLKTIRRQIRDGREMISTRAGLEQARSALLALDRIERSLEIDTKEELPRLLAEKRVEETGNLAWAYEAARRLKAMDLNRLEKHNLFVATQMREYVRLFRPFMSDQTPTEDELIAMRQTTTEEIRRITEIIRHIDENPKAITEDGLRELSVAVPPSEVASTIADVRTRMEMLVPDILSKLNHPTAKALNLANHIEEFKRKIQHDLATERGEYVHRAKMKMKQLENVNQVLALIDQRNSELIVRVDDKDAYRKIAGMDSLGCYSYEAGRIFLNTTLIRERQLNPADVIEHEIGHAMIDAFRRTNVFPSILLDLHEKLKYERTSSGQSMQELLVKRASAWGIAIENTSSLTAEERWKLMDELANRYGLWKLRGKPKVHEDERALFNLFMTGMAQANEIPLRLTGFVQQHEDEEGAGGHDEHSEGGTSAQGSSVDTTGYVDSKLEALDKKILNIDAFLSAYPQYRQEFDEVLNYSDVRRKVGEAKGKFRRGTHTEDPDFEATLEQGTKVTDQLLDFIKDVDREKSDLTHEGKTGGRTVWQMIKEDVEWVSLYDLLAMFKDAGEDISRMWKRRGEGARNRLGKTVSGLIHDKVPYLGRLKHEFERRDRTSEQEEVDVWEKGLEKIDAHELQHKMLPYVKSKDQLKAIINLLTKRGRLDWDDDHGLWQRLEHFSGYRMPREASKRNTILRNAWLQKMIADIWRDKDLYEHWKAENDGAIESGRKHLDPYVEELAALSALRTKLRELLFNFDKMKMGYPVSKEEEVNPHLYEGILFYAMRNGKMTMEEKFFYLVRGVERGLLSIDRLRVFSGENFGILNTFPFIDFFSSGQNNTIHEIRQINRKITETGPDADPYKPGSRTTKFLMEVVAFDKNVNDRVNKALKRAENVDHEDIPMYVTQVDYVGVSTIINFTSGSQWKVSPPAMKNGYVGYNSFIKYFAMKAAIGRPPLTDRDITKIATTLGGYTLWDNIITRESIGGDRGSRPFLSWQQIKNEVPVSGDKKTYEYRDAMNAFTLRLCREVNLTQVNGIDIEDYIGLRRHGKTIDEIEAKYRARNINRGEIFKRIETAPQEFVDKLDSLLKQNPTTLSRILIEMQESFIPESDQFTLQKVQPIWESNGNGNHGHAPAAAAHP